MSEANVHIDQDIFNNSIDFTGTKILLYIGDDLAIFEQRDEKGNFPFEIDLIGGGRNGKESPFETIVREVYEETGLTTIEENLIHAKAWPSITQEAKTAYFFVARLEQRQIHSVRQGNEGLGIVFLDPKVFVELNNGVEGQQAKVRDYLTTYAP